MKNGFTLIELIAVISIIGVLSLMIVPRVLESLNEATENSMIVTENQILDAANLYLEDYCRNPISDEYRSYCNTDKKSAGTGKVYFCLSTLQGRGLIKGEVYYKESSSCKGIVLYNYESNRYSNPKVYLYCEDEYITEGGSTYKNYANGC